VIHFGALGVDQSFAGVRRIGVGEDHGTICRFDIGTTHAKTPRRLSAGFAAKLRIASLADRQNGSAPMAASLLTIADASVASAGRNDASRGSNFDVDQRHVASGSRGQVVWRR
jgi:hypothetical protein